MITISVLNTQELAEKEVGSFKVMMGQFFGRDIDDEVMNRIYDELRYQLARNSVAADITYQGTQLFVHINGVYNQGFFKDLLADFMPDKVEKKVAKQVKKKLRARGVKVRVTRS